jgi:hypothetical protein
MRLSLTLLFLFAWPWSHKPHVENFTVTVSSDGKTVHTFKHKFAKPPACTAPAGKGLEWYVDRVVVHGKPGDVVSGTCK